MFFVGERDLICQGAKALFDLTPAEFHGIFAPLLAAMGDADTMDDWLASTESLAEVDLSQIYDRSMDHSEKSFEREGRAAVSMTTDSSEVSLPGIT